MDPKPYAFVAMPFSSEFADAYVLAIKPACQAAGVDCERVDEQIYFQNILERIYCEIERADIIIGEMSGRNENVYYEIGYAHGIGKPVILLTKDASDIPFDLRHYPHVVYGGSLATLKDELTKRVSWCIANYPQAVKEGPRHAMRTRALGDKQIAKGGSSDSLLDFFVFDESSNGRLDLEVAAKEDGSIVLYYSLPLKVHIKKVECFIDEREIVFHSEQNTRRSIGLPISDSVLKHTMRANEIYLVRKHVPSMEEIGYFKVPLAVYGNSTVSE